MQQSIVSALNSGALTIAHRGARSIAPENTIAAARKALVAGAHMWESDIRMTRDGELVLIHDVSLMRTSNVRMRFPERCPWNVHDFTLAELRSLDFGSWFAQSDPFGQVQAGVLSGNDLEQYSGEPLPTLEEALLFTVSNLWLMNIEIKDLSGLPGHDSIVEKVVHLVRLLDAVDRVIISSFNHNYLAQLRAIDPRIITGALVNRSPHDVVKLMDDLGVLTFHPRLLAVRPRQIRELRQKGLSTLVWVVNSRKVVQLLYGMGADGFFTDFPQAFTNNSNDKQ